MKQNLAVWIRYSPEKTPSLIVFSGEYLIQTEVFVKGTEQIKIKEDKGR